MRNFLTLCLLAVILLFIFSCEKERDVKTNIEVVVHKPSDTFYFDIEKVDINIFKNGSRNGVWASTLFYLTSLSTDNFMVAFAGEPRKHTIFSHIKIDTILFTKVSSGTAILNDGANQVEVANYNINIVYTDGTTEVLVGYLAPYFGETYVFNPTSSLIHVASNAKKVYFEQIRGEMLLGYRLPYKPQVTINLPKWNQYIDNVFSFQFFKEPEDNTSNVWRPKHRV